MNVIKFTDKWFEDTKAASTMNTFNKYFANKYAIAPRFTYIFTLDCITPATYALVEKYGIKDFKSSKLEYAIDEETGEFVLEEDDVEKAIKEVPYVTIVIPTPEGDVEVNNIIGLRYDTYSKYIDEAATTKAQSVAKYIAENDYISDIDITIEDLKNFRTWLAEHLLLEDANNDDIEFDEEVSLMLNYYKNGMIDEVINAFNVLSKYENIVNLTSMSTTGCGCTSNVNNSILQMFKNSSIGAKMSTMDLSSITLSTCDPIAIYRKAMYYCMVVTFRDYKFWQEMSKPFILEFAKYIKGILENNFPLYQSDWLTTFADCDCLNNANASQEALRAVLEKLYKSLMYIYNDEISGNKNYINDALYQWAAKLYERMYWI